MKNVFEAAHRKVVCELVDEDRLEDDCHESSQCHDRRNSVMVKRHPTALLLSSTLTIPLLLAGWAYDPPLPGYDGDLIEGEPVTIPGTGTFELIGITLSRWGNSPETIIFCFTPDPNLLDNAKKHLPPGQTLPPQDEN